MTVQWIDTPGSMLPTRSDAVDFAVSSEPACISVSFGAGRAEERAYRDGAFLVPYLASTREGNVFALRRAGGWPMPPTVYVDEAAAASVLKTIYEVDFTAQPSQSLAATGPHTIDGKRWNVKGVTPGGMSSSLVSGAGLRITCVGGAGIAYSATGSYVHRLLAFPLAQFENFDPGAPIAVLGRFTTATDGHVSAYLGLISTTDDGEVFAGAQRGSQVWVGTPPCSPPSSAATTMYALGGNDDAFKIATHGVPAHTSIGQRAIGMYRVTPRAAISASFAWAGTLPADMSSATDGLGVARAAADPTSHHVAFIGRSQTGIAAWDVTMTHLRIMQLRQA